MKGNLKPIVVLSQFKSGTWLLRRIIEGLTGLSMIEPDYGHDTGLDPEDPEHVFWRPGTYYSWHATPSAAVRDKLERMDARVILLVRNVYDMVVSQYHHFADDIDREIGRSAGRKDFFASVSSDFGLAVTIAGYHGQTFTQPGYGFHLRQMQVMLEFAAAYPACLVTYEQLVDDRSATVGRIASYLEADVSRDHLEAVVAGSSFDAMRAVAATKGVTSHFRKGRTLRHGDELKPAHAALLALEMARCAPDLSSLATSAGLPILLELRLPSEVDPVSGQQQARQ